MNVHTRFYRRRNESMVAGVASGIARALDVDAWVIRLIFLILVIGFGTGVLLYFILWMLMPLETPGMIVEPYPFDAPATNRNRSLVGVVLMLVGMYMLINIFAPQLWRYAIPALLITGGIILFSQTRTK